MFLTKLGLLQSHGPGAVPVAEGGSLGGGYGGGEGSADPHPHP